jgi:superfamily II DNA or RNA helicase
MTNNYEWQNEAIDVFIKNKKLIVEVATGAGKTFFSIQTIKQLLKKEPNLKILIVSPKIVILKNWQQELLKNGFCVVDVGMYYSAIKDYARITLTTNASIKNINLNLFDFLVVDEVHNTFTPRFKKVYDKNFKYLLGLTATLNNEDDTKHYEFLDYFNYNKYVFTIKEAINSNIINKFVFTNYSFVFDKKLDFEQYENYQQRITNIIRVAGSYNKAMRSQLLRNNLYSLFDKRKKLVYMHDKRFDLLEKILKINKDKKIIIFNEYNAAGTEIYMRCLDLNLSARVINSDLDTQTIDKHLQSYVNNEYNILITSKMFDEGYNLPSIDVAIIFSGDSTKRQFIQRMGRVLRKKIQRSKIYQIYCKGTFDEIFADKRTKIIKEIETND